MNCKQGDLAVIVRSHAGNEGKLVRCLELIGLRCWFEADGSVSTLWTWRIDTPLFNAEGELFPDIADDQLRPIRPGEGDDETLSWAGKPVKEIA
jgi:hypothetical protein